MRFSYFNPILKHKATHYKFFLSALSKYKSSVIYDSIPLIRHWMVVGVSYFAYDLLAMYAVFKAGATSGVAAVGWRDFLSSRPLIIVHHVLLPFVVVALFLMQGRIKGDYLIAVFTLAEASTPFVSSRRILEILGEEKFTSTYR